jgi:hypothetical protein
MAGPQKAHALLTCPTDFPVSDRHGRENVEVMLSQKPATSVAAAGPEFRIGNFISLALVFCARLSTPLIFHQFYLLRQSFLRLARISNASPRFYSPGRGLPTTDFQFYLPCLDFLRLARISVVFLSVLFASPEFSALGQDFKRLARILFASPGFPMTFIK